METQTEIMNWDLMNKSPLETMQWVHKLKDKITLK